MSITRLSDRANGRAGEPVSGRRRILVVSAGMGAGHHAAADELVRRLQEAGHEAERIDTLLLGRPGQGRRLRQTYLFLLRRLPWAYDGAMRFWARWPRPLETFTSHAAAAYEDGLVREVQRFSPDVVVSVYNLASQALGRLREAGRIHVPVATYVVDPGPHPYWFHPAVDLHLTTLPETAKALRAYGARRTVVVDRLVRPAFSTHEPRRSEARRRLGLPPDAAVALVNGGSWAAGGLEQTVICLARSGAVFPVTLCGKDADLRRRLARLGAGVALGWTDDMPSLLAAADVLVDNAGGLTCGEAVACGLPIVLFRPLPGHGRINAETLEQAGVAVYAHSGHELVSLVRVLATAHAAGWQGFRGPGGTASRDAVREVLNLSVRAGAR